MDELIAENPAIFDVSDVEREKVYDELLKRLARSLKRRRPMPKAERELRRALRLDEATKRAADEAEFREWLAMINAPITDEERAQCVARS